MPAPPTDAIDNERDLPPRSDRPGRRVVAGAIGATLGAGIAVASAVPLPAGLIVGDRILTLARDSRWVRVESVHVTFDTFHPQGMVRIGDTFLVSSVEVLDRDAGRGIGHLFKIDRRGNLVSGMTLGEGKIYHPGGIDFDGKDVWIPVAEYRQNSRSIVYRVDPEAWTQTEVLRVADHIGAIVHDTDSRALHGVSWGSRRFYRWPIDRSGKSGPPTRRENPSHYVDYQDCKYVGRQRMLCSGVTEMRQAPGAPLFRLGGLDLVNLVDGRPLHQVPVLLWTDSGMDMTHNPVWIEPGASGLRAYFMPEDNRSTIYVYEVAAAASGP